MSEEDVGTRRTNWPLIIGVVVGVGGLVVCLGGVCTISALTTLGSNLSTTFDYVATEVD